MDNPAALYHRVLSMFGRGELTASKEGRAPTYQIDQGPKGPDGKSHGIRDDLVAVAHFGFASAPPIGAKILAFFLGGDRANGVGFGSYHAATRPANLGRGDSCQYDVRGRRVWLAEDGIVIDGAGGPVTVVNATVVRIECARLEVTGDIIDNCDDNGKSLKDLRDAYNVHKHTGVTTGGGTSGLTDHLVS